MTTNWCCNPFLFFSDYFKDIFFVMVFLLWFRQETKHTHTWYMYLDFTKDHWFLLCHNLQSKSTWYIRCLSMRTIDWIMRKFNEIHSLFCFSSKSTVNDQEKMKKKKRYHTSGQQHTDPLCFQWFLIAMNMPIDRLSWKRKSLSFFVDIPSRKRKHHFMSIEKVLGILLLHSIRYRFRYGLS